MNIIFLIGCSGSGKSTFAEQFLVDNKNYLRINRDDIRKTLVKNLDGYYQRKDTASLEHIVSNVEQHLAYNYWTSVKNILIDNTNLSFKYLSVWMLFAKRHNYNIKFKLFDCNPNIAKYRVLKRDYNTMCSENELPSEFIENKVSYIDKQYNQYLQIKKYILENYKEKIISNE